MHWFIWAFIVAVATTFYYWRQRLHREVTLAIATQAAGMRVVSWVIDRAFDQVDGLVSIEAVVSDRHGHDASIQVMKPTMPASSSETTTCEEFIRLNYVPGTKFKIEEARIEVRQGGQLHVIRFNHHHLNTLLSVVLDVVSQMTSQEDASVDGLPVRAELRWVPPPTQDDNDNNADDVKIDRSLYSVHHDVTPAISRLAGPRARWWRLEGDETPLFVVTNHAIISECLRYLYDLRSTHRLMRHLSRCEVTIHFLSGETFVIDSSAGADELSRPFFPMN